MARGYSGFADVMKTTADGRDINELFAEFREAAVAANEGRQRFIDLLTYPTETPTTTVLQTLGAANTRP